MVAPRDARTRSGGEPNAGNEPQRYVSSQARYLAWGRRTLDELSLSQQVWQPPFIHVPALGGFGVMNADGQWKLINRTGNPRVVRVVCDDGSSFEVRLEETARIR